MQKKKRTALEATIDVVGRDQQDQILYLKKDEADKARLRELQVVSTDENACWLIDYWCGKDIGGLLRMPFSRHWIMHIEASLRIKNKIYPR